MKKIIYFILFSFLALCIYLFLSYILLPLSSRGLQEYYVIKDYINNNVPKNKKRLIIMSASDGMYGIVGEMIDKQTNYYPINYSMYFGTSISLEYRIEKLISSLHQGDTVLLPLNYGFYFEESNIRDYGYIQNMLAWGDRKIAFRDKSALIDSLFRSPPSKFFYGLFSIIRFSKSHTKIIQKSLWHWSNVDNSFNGVSIASLDKYGELKNHNGVLLKPDIAEDYFKNQQISKYFVQQYQKLKQYADKNNIKLIFTYPPTLKNSLFDLQNPHDFLRIQKLQDQLKSIGIILEGSAVDSQYCIKDFYDTSYHLNTEGAKKNTQRLIKILMNI